MKNLIFQTKKTLRIQVDWQQIGCNIHKKFPHRERSWFLFLACLPKGPMPMLQSAPDLTKSRTMGMFFLEMAMRSGVFKKRLLLQRLAGSGQTKLGEMVFRTSRASATLFSVMAMYRRQRRSLVSQISLVELKLPMIPMSGICCCLLLLLLFSGVLLFYDRILTSLRFYVMAGLTRKLDEWTPSGPTATIWWLLLLSSSLSALS